MRKLFGFLILAVTALGLTAFGLVAANYAAKDPAGDPAIGTTFGSPIHAAPGDRTPWQI
jgi:hypothetical protein